MPCILVNIDVPDLEQGITFYCAAFDLRLARRLGPDFAELTGAASPIYLLQTAAGTKPFANAAKPRDYHRHWTPIHLDFVVPDLNTALTRALAAGAHQDAAPSDHPYGRQALLSDPFGHGICLLQFNVQGYDAIPRDR